MPPSVIRRFYQVLPRDGQWVVWETRGMLVGTFATKEAAIEAACDQAKSRGGIVTVWGEDGSVEREIDCRVRKD